MAIICIPTTMQKYTQDRSKIEVSGATVLTALEQLVSLYPDLQSVIFGKNQQLKGYLNIFIDETDIREAEYLDTEIQSESELLLVPAVVGG
ncbi:MoaD/ThiS family protein [Vibrio ostreicida]|uniref:MoaD/ThiS family protein n=1 Tax=Vibrio ostreicida TaxID=526588 RepID=A0ABT8BUF9_9VIBR|nr:MoaD/ThiS family protein [Vibrio ostreicida]MDN3610407.1 MoaD/ThiS family protein [Vibrio ostreicida]NPD07583.1 hypothetical protein [Vibrio ostreicida]